MTVNGTEQRVYGKLLTCQIWLHRIAVVYGSVTLNPSEYSIVYYGDEESEFVTIKACSFNDSGISISFFLQDHTTEREVTCIVELRECIKCKKYVVVRVVGTLSLEKDISIWFNDSDTGEEKDSWIFISSALTGNVLDSYAKTIPFVEPLNGPDKKIKNFCRDNNNLCNVLPAACLRPKFYISYGYSYNPNVSWYKPPYDISLKPTDPWNNNGRNSSQYIDYFQSRIRGAGPDGISSAWFNAMGVYIEYTVTCNTITMTSGIIPGHEFPCSDPGTPAYNMFWHAYMYIWYIDDDNNFHIINEGYGRWYWGVPDPNNMKRVTVTLPFDYTTNITRPSIPQVIEQDSNLTITYHIPNHVNLFYFMFPDDLFLHLTASLVPRYGTNICSPIKPVFEWNLNYIKSYSNKPIYREFHLIPYRDIGEYWIHRDTNQDYAALVGTTYYEIGNNLSAPSVEYPCVISSTYMPNVPESRQKYFNEEDGLLYEHRLGFTESHQQPILSVSYHQLGDINYSGSDIVHKFTESQIPIIFLQEESFYVNPYIIFTVECKSKIYVGEGAIELKPRYIGESSRARDLTGWPDAYTHTYRNKDASFFSARDVYEKSYTEVKIITTATYDDGAFEGYGSTPYATGCVINDILYIPAMVANGDHSTIASILTYYVSKTSIPNSIEIISNGSHYWIKQGCKMIKNLRAFSSVIKIEKIDDDTIFVILNDYTVLDPSQSKYAYLNSETLQVITEPDLYDGHGACIFEGKMITGKIDIIDVIDSQTFSTNLYVYDTYPTEINYELTNIKRNKSLHFSCASDQTDPFGKHLISHNGYLYMFSNMNWFNVGSIKYLKFSSLTDANPEYASCSADVDENSISLGTMFSYNGSLYVKCINDGPLCKFNESTKEFTSIPNTSDTIGRSLVCTNDMIFSINENSGRDIADAILPHIQIFSTSNL